MKADTVMQYATETSVIIHDYIAFPLTLSISNYVFLGITQRWVTPFVYFNFWKDTHDIAYEYAMIICYIWTQNNFIFCNIFIKM